MRAREIEAYRFNSGSCNGCDIEILAALAPRFKFSGLSIKLMDVPEDANVLLVTGPVNVKIAGKLREVYEKLKEPRTVVAIGACALSKGIFDGSYSVLGPAEEIVPISTYVPGCPPRPQAIVGALARELSVKLEVLWPTPEGFRGKTELDPEKCNGCGACTQVCPTGAAELVDKGGRRTVRLQHDKCVFCGLCEEACPEEAIRLVQEYRLEVRNRSQAVSTAEIELAKCSVCGSFFASPRQAENALGRVIKRVEKYREFRDLLRKWLETCPKCRGTLENIKRAKSLMVELTAEVLR